MDRESKLRIAVVGAGYVAGHHLAALSRLDFVELVGLCDPNQEAANALAAKHKVGAVAASLDGLAHAKPHAVYVLTPPVSHFAIAMQALEMGCHVFVEKPLAESVAECDALIARARELGLRLSVNHSDRFDPVVLKALAIVQSGACGDIVMVDILRSSEYPAYAGGPLPALVAQGSYPLRDLGVHALYTLEAFLGPLANADIHYRSSGTQPNLEFDEWHGEVRGPRGCGRFLLSWTSRPMESRLVVRGTRGTIEIDRFLQTCTFRRVLPGPKFLGMFVGGALFALRDTFLIPWNVVRFLTGMLRPSPGIQAGAAGFARALHEGRAPPVDADEGRRALALLEPACARADAERTATLESRYTELAPVDTLVTGAAGLLGRALVAALRRRGESVRVLVRKPVAAYADDPGVQVVVGDLGDPRIVDHAVAGTKLVYHVGAAMKGSLRDFEAGTTWGTRNVVDSCLAHRTSRLVYVSSLSVLDHAGRDPAVRVVESSALEPQPQKRGAYTQTKLAAENFVREACASRGLPAVIVRPGQIVGPGSERVTPNGTVAIAGRWFAIGPAQQVLPLVYLDDVVDALILAARLPQANGQLFNVVDPEQVEQGEYLARCRQRVGPSLKVVRVPTGMFMLLAHGVELLGKVLKRDVPLTRYRVRSLAPLANFDLTAARETLGWKPRIGLRSGLDTTFGPYSG